MNSPVCWLNQNGKKNLYEESDSTASGGSFVSLCTARINFYSRNLTKISGLFTLAKILQSRNGEGCYYPQWQKRSAG